MTEMKIGKYALVSAVVDDTNTALAVESGGLAVFSTPMMIALMERAAFECLEENLEPGQTSVGTAINISHNVACPVGAEITATAIIDGIFERRIEFSVAACDNHGEIGNGKHTRMIVDSQRLMDKAIARSKQEQDNL